jgi:BirA family biotin operon repressor/biotin-[acetyl-CoA-carboxylase] ligase
MKTTTPDLIILRKLLRAGDAFVSGSDLAEALGISRVAIWQHMEKLRDRGYAFEAIRSRGYRLTARPTALDALLIQAHLPSDVDCRVVVLDSIDSTNDEAMRRINENASLPLAVIAREQTKGRGRLGRTWLSEPNGNLYLSFAFHPQVPPGQLPTMTPWVGVNLCNLLADHAGVEPRIKWPNDLLINDRKVGGILAEARLDADRIHDLVIGCGLNLLTPSAGWPDELADRAVALDEAAGAPLDHNAFAAELITRLLKTCLAFQDGHYADRLAELWHRYDALRDQPVTLLQSRQEISGTGHGIDSSGALVLELADGSLRTFHAGEVTLARR